jgi:hypothetical protein
LERLKGYQMADETGGCMGELKRLKGCQMVDETGGCIR